MQQVCRGRDGIVKKHQTRRTAGDTTGTFGTEGRRRPGTKHWEDEICTLQRHDKEIRRLS